MQRARLKVILGLAVMVVPLRVRGQAGAMPAVLVPNVRCIEPSELEMHLAPIIVMLEARHIGREAVAPLSVDQLTLLKQAMPSFVSPLIDFIVSKIGGNAAARALGISQARIDNTEGRFVRETRNTTDREKPVRLSLIRSDIWGSVNRLE